jgi:hypothetical protein
MRVGAYFVVPAIAVAACTRILGIDGRYVMRQEDNLDSGGPHVVIGAGGQLDSGSAAGGREPASGGSGAGTGTGGVVAAGGMPMGSGGAGGMTSGSGGSTGGSESGGTIGSGGTPPADGQAACPPGQKRCAKVGCVNPDPSVGCDPAADCTPCGFPMNSSPICAGTKCDYACYTDFTRNTSTGVCEQTSSGSGGAGGAGGTSSGRLGSPCTKVTPTSSSPECKGCIGFLSCCNATLHCGCLYALGVCV